MYSFIIKINGKSEYYTTKNVSKIQRKIKEKLEAECNWYNPKHLPSIRTLQKALKQIEVNQNIFFQIEKLYVIITKGTIL